MDLIDSISRRAVREYFSKMWLTHDAMWFYHCMSEIGIEKTNRINKAAVRSMALVEVKRFQKLIGIGQGEVSGFGNISNFLEQAIALVRTDFMPVTVSSPEDGVLRFEFENDRCFAFEGLSKMGFIEGYECAVFERIEAWFQGMGVAYEIEPRVVSCMKLKGEKCYRDCRIV